MIGTDVVSTKANLKDPQFLKAVDALAVGNQHFFKEYLINNNITEVDLSITFEDELKFIKPLDHELTAKICQSFEGTPVKKLSLLGNNLSNSLPRIIRNLKGTNVKEVDIGNNYNGREFNNNYIGANYYTDLDPNTESPMVTLAKAIKETDIDTLHLTRNHLHEFEVVTLLTALQGKSFQEIDLTGNDVSFGILTKGKIKEALAGLKVKSFNLKSNQYDESTALNAYYSTIFSDVIPTEVKKQLNNIPGIPNTKESALKAGVGILIFSTLPHDVRRNILDMTTKGKFELYQQIRRKCHPVAIPQPIVQPQPQNPGAHTIGRAAMNAFLASKKLLGLGKKNRP